MVVMDMHCSNCSRIIIEPVMLSLGMSNKGIWLYQTVEFYVSASETNQDAHSHVYDFRIQEMDLL